MTPTPAVAVHCAPFASEGECDAAIAALGRASWLPGRTAEPDGRSADAGPRRSCALTRDVPEALVARAVAEVARLGREGFGYSLDGTHPADPPHIMRYGSGDEFEWHLDCGLDVAPFASRKLSFVLQLSDPADYAGGDLQLAAYHLGYAPEALAGQRAAARTRGALIVFGAFQLHRVTRVTRGTRYALVGWLHGPPFR